MITMIPEIRGVVVKHRQDECPMQTFCLECLHGFISESPGNLNPGQEFRVYFETSDGEYTHVTVENIQWLEADTFLAMFDKTEWEMVRKLHYHV